MRHGNKVNNLKRKKAHRRALLANLTINLIEHKRIFTTLAKAKALRKYSEPLFTKAKTNDTHNRRVVFSYLQNKEAIKEMFDVVGPKIADRPGGYTRIIKLAPRQGDAAEIAMIELVDFNESGYTGKVEKGGTAKKKRTRRKKKTTTAATTATETAATEEAASAEVEEAPSAQVEDVVEETTVEDVVEETPVEENPIAETPAEEESTEEQETSSDEEE